MTWLTVMEYLCIVCRKHILVLSSFMSYHWVCKNSSNMMAVTSGVGTVYPSRAPEFIPSFSGVPSAQSLVFCVVFCRPWFFLLSYLFLPLYFLSCDSRLLITPLAFIFAIVFSVLRFTTSPFGIYFCHCIFCPAIHDFPLWHLFLPLYFLSCNSRLPPLAFIFAIVFSVLRFTTSDYPFGIYFCHCIFCPSTIHDFRLPLWHLQIVSLWQLKVVVTSLPHSCIVFRNGLLCDKVCQWLAAGLLFFRVVQFPPPTKLTTII